MESHSLRFGSCISLNPYGDLIIGKGSSVVLPDTEGRSTLMGDSEVNPNTEGGSTMTGSFSLVKPKTEGGSTITCGGPSSDSEWDLCLIFGFAPCSWLGWLFEAISRSKNLVAMGVMAVMNLMNAGKVERGFTSLIFSRPTPDWRGLRIYSLVRWGEAWLSCAWRSGVAHCRGRISRRSPDHYCLSRGEK